FRCRFFLTGFNKEDFSSPLLSVRKKSVFFTDFFFISVSGSRKGIVNALCTASQKFSPEMAAALPDLKSFGILVGSPFGPQRRLRKVCPILIPHRPRTDFLFLMPGKISLEMLPEIWQHFLSHIRQIADKARAEIGSHSQVIKHQMVTGSIGKSGKQLWLFF